MGFLTKIFGGDGNAEDSKISPEQLDAALNEVLESRLKPLALDVIADKEQIIDSAETVKDGPYGYVTKSSFQKDIKQEINRILKDLQTIESNAAPDPRDKLVFPQDYISVEEHEKFRDPNGRPERDKIRRDSDEINDSGRGYRPALIRLQAMEKLAVLIGNEDTDRLPYGGSTHVDVEHFNERSREFNNQAKEILKELEAIRQQVPGQEPRKPINGPTSNPYIYEPYSIGSAPALADNSADKKSPGGGVSTPPDSRNSLSGVDPKRPVSPVSPGL